MATRQQKHQRRPDARPDEILDAALWVFSEKGFAAARMDDVAARAGLSKGAIYLYFASKDAVFEAIVRRFAEGFAATAAARVLSDVQTDPEQAVRHLLRRLLSVLSDPRASAVPRLVIAEAPRFPAIAALYRREVIRRVEHAFDGLLTAGVARGVFRPVDGPAALRALIGPVLAHMLLTLVFVDEKTPPLDPVATADALADMVLHGLKVRPGDAR